MNEFKIEINLDETIVSYRDFKNYINRAKNQNSELYKQLRSYVNISKLEPIFSVTQHRDRFYLQDNDGKTIFTISFCLLYTSPSPRDRTRSRMPSSA